MAQPLVWKLLKSPICSQVKLILNCVEKKDLFPFDNNATVNISFLNRQKFMFTRVKMCQAFFRRFFAQQVDEDELFIEKDSFLNGIMPSFLFQVKFVD